jgi:hypothetical protein
MHRKSMMSLSAAAITVGIAMSASAAPITFSEGGSTNPADIQDTVDAFRAALGNPNNGNAAGTVGGRREINWDGGGGVSATTPPIAPFNVFLNTRGALFTTPGLGLTQATPEGLGVLASNITYTTTFGTFSPLRLFAPIGSNITDGLFFVPGTNGGVPATVSGFGAVFTDVDLANTTKIDFFGPGGILLHSAFAPVGTTSNASLSFLGVFFNAGEEISRVRITTGNAALGPNDGGAVDVVAIDDVLYSEPVAVPAPGSLALLASGIGLLLLRTLSDRRKRAAA